MKTYENLVSPPGPVVRCVWSSGPVGFRIFPSNHQTVHSPLFSLFIRSLNTGRESRENWTPARFFFRMLTCDQASFFLAAKKGTPDHGLFACAERLCTV